MKKTALFLVTALCCLTTACNHGTNSTVDSSDYTSQDSAQSSVSVDESDSIEESTSEDISIEDSVSEEDENVFTITYDENSPNNSTAIVDNRTQRVGYGESFTLQIPRCPGYTFLYWTREGENTPFQQTTYLLQEDVTLVAKWELNVEDSFWWTENG